MTPRLTSAVLVSAMVRQTQAGGGNAAILVRGDATAGAILMVLAERGRIKALVERVLGTAGGYALAPTGPVDLDEPGVVTDYIARRRARDPDLWVVELDGPDSNGVARSVIG